MCTKCTIGDGHVLDVDWECVVEFPSDFDAIGQPVVTFAEPLAVTLNLGNKKDGTIIQIIHSQVCIFALKLFHFKSFDIKCSCYLTEFTLQVILTVEGY